MIWPTDGEGTLEEFTQNKLYEYGREEETPAAG